MHTSATVSSLCASCTKLDTVAPAKWTIMWLPQVADVLRSPYGATAGGPSSLPTQRSASVTTAVAATAKHGLEGAAAPGALQAVSAASTAPASSDAARDAQESAAEQQQQQQGALTAGGAATAQQPPAERPSPFAAFQGKGSSGISAEVGCIEHAVCRGGCMVDNVGCARQGPGSGGF